MTASPISFPSSTDRFLLDNWNMVASVFPSLASTEAANKTMEVTAFREDLSGNAPVYSLFIFVLALILVSRRLWR